MDEVLSFFSRAPDLSIEAQHLRFAIGYVDDLSKVRGAAREFIAQEGGERACLEKAIDEDGYTSMCAAAGSGRPDVIGMLLEEGASPNTPGGPNGITPLALASLRGEEDIVLQLLSAGADIDGPDAQRMPALDMAAFSGHLNIVTALLAAGAHVAGSSLPMAAAQKGHAPVIRALISAGAAVDGKGGSPAVTPLLWAACHNHDGAMQELLSAGASVAEALALAREMGWPEAGYRLAAALTNLEYFDV